MPLLRRRWFPRQLTSFPPIPSFSNLPRPVTVAVLVALARVVLVPAARVTAAVLVAMARVVLVPAARVTAAALVARARVVLVLAGRVPAAGYGELAGVGPVGARALTAAVLVVVA